MTRTPVPSEFQSQEPTATEKQQSFILSLLGEREFEPKKGETIETVRAQVPALTKKQASKWIERLLDLPKRKIEIREGSSYNISGNRNCPLPDVPEGRYAVEIDGDLKFYVVDKPTEGRWAGWTFLSVQASDEKYPIKNFDSKRKIMTEIAVDPRAASARYGHELGHCGICGRTLTNEESRELGIGPVCARRNGWL